MKKKLSKLTARSVKRKRAAVMAAILMSTFLVVGMLLQIPAVVHDSTRRQVIVVHDGSEEEMTLGGVNNRA